MKKKDGKKEGRKGKKK